MTTIAPYDSGTRLALQPSRTVPGIPPFYFAIPAGWLIEESPGALAVVRPPDKIAGFWVNAILSHDKVARSVDHKQMAAATWVKLVREFADAVVKLERLIDVDGVPTYLRGSEMASPSDQRQIAQLHAIFFAPTTDAGTVVDCFHIVCTAPTEVADNIGAKMMDMILSFRFV